LAPGTGAVPSRADLLASTLQLQHLDLPTTDEPFAAVILCTADRRKVDKRTRSKWSRLLRYSAEYKLDGESLAAFVRRKGGINKCAARFTRCPRPIRSKVSVLLFCMRPTESAALVRIQLFSACRRPLHRRLVESEKPCVTAAIARNCGVNSSRCSAARLLSGRSRRGRSSRPCP
jgi:hypothetical protein